MIAPLRLINTAGGHVISTSPIALHFYYSDVEPLANKATLILIVDKQSFHLLQ